MPAEYVTLFPSMRIERDLTKREPITTQPGVTGFTTVVDGREEVYCVVHLDNRALISMLHTAAHNKSRQSVDGPIRVKVLARRRL